MARTVMTKRSVKAPMRGKLPSNKVTKNKPVRGKGPVRCKPAPKPVKVAAKAVVARITKKVIAKKSAAPLSKEEKEQLKLEREKVREERLKIKEERARIRAEKEELKQEKLRMWELVPTTSVSAIKTNPFLTKAVKRENPTQNCCLFCNNRSVLQAAIYKDYGALKAYLADHGNINNPFQKFGIDCNENLLRTVVKQKDFDSFKLVIDYLTKNRREAVARVKLP